MVKLNEVDLDIDEGDDEYPVCPPGKYLGVITNADFGKSNNGREMLMLEITIESDGSKYKVWDNILTNLSSTDHEFLTKKLVRALKIAYGDDKLAALKNSGAEIDFDEVAMLLENKGIELKTKIEMYNGENQAKVNGLIQSAKKTTAAADPPKTITASAAAEPTPDKEVEEPF